MNTRQSHNVTSPFVTIQTRYESCQHVFYRNRQVELCGAPTEDGKPTCKSCKALEMAGPRQLRKDLITTYV